MWFGALATGATSQDWLLGMRLRWPLPREPTIFTAHSFRTRYELPPRSGLPQDRSWSTTHTLGLNMNPAFASPGHRTLAIQFGLPCRGPFDNHLGWTRMQLSS